MASLVLLMVFLSGLTGLMYQVTWQKYLSIYLGSHALSTALTLSGFFLFMALGYSIIGKWGHRLGKNKILTYAYIEALIGGYAIVSPQLFTVLYEVWPSYPSDTLMHFVSSLSFSALLMGFPTFLMGGTIPLLTQGLSERLQDSHRTHAFIYGTNTLGAVIGSLLSGFYFLQAFGLEQSLNITGVVNCLICVFLIVYCKVTGLKFEGYTPEQNAVNEKNSVQYRLLTISFLSGFLSFGLESLSIRMAGISMGSSNYTYTVIVTSFIISIALGSFLASLVTEKNCTRWLVFSQVGLVLSLAGLHWLIPHWPNIFMRLRLLFASSDLNFTVYWVSVLILYFLFLVIPVALMGMTLPLLFQQLKSRGRFLTQTAGQMYALNSLGATLGAIVLGYLIFFVLNGHQVFGILIMISAACCYLLLDLFKPNAQWYLRASPLGLGLAFVLILPGWSDYSFVPSRFFTITKTITQSDYDRMIETMDPKYPYVEKILFSDFGVNTYTVVTEDFRGHRTLYVNGKPDASTEGDRETRTLTALIPLTLSEKNKDIFIVGLGTGMSAGIAAAFDGTESIKVSEIASGVIDSLPYFSKWNFGLEENMDKIKIVHDDAYKVLKNEEQTYDLIFSEPSNTWVSGVEKIYTREFLQSVSSKLRPHGMYAQWFPMFAMTEKSMLSILSNFKASFKHVTLWSATGLATIILASHEPLKVDLDRLKEKGLKMKEIYKSINHETAEEILYHQIWSDPAITDLANAATIEHSLYHPTLAYQSGIAFFTNEMINFEKIARETFSVPLLKLRKKRDLSGLYTSEAEDVLLWEKVKHQLPLSFFENGIRYTLNVHKIVSSKISLALAELFPEQDEKDWQFLKRSKEIRVLQNKYITGVTKEVPPNLAKESFLPNELYRRYLEMSVMRTQADFNRILSMIPDSCGIQKECHMLKYEILTYLKEQSLESFMEYGQNYESMTEKTKEIENQFAQVRSEILDL